MDMNQYLEIFIEETKEHVQSLNQCLLQLEQNPDDNSVLNEIFRAAHTLKGMSGTMGFNKMAKLTHDMEDVLQALRNNQLKVSTKLVDILFRCLDALEDYLKCIIDSGSEGNNDYVEIIRALACVARGESIEDEPVNHNAGEQNTAVSNGASSLNINVYEQNLINKSKEMGLNAFRIRIALNKGCVLKSARSFIIFQTLERYSDIIKSEPKVEDIEDEKFDFEFTVAVITQEDEAMLMKELSSIAEVDDIVISTLEAKAIEDSDNSEAEQVHNEGEKAESQNTEDMKLTSDSNPKPASNTARPKTGKTVRVDIERLDVLMNLVSELIIIKTRLEDMGNDDSTKMHAEAVEYLERITTSLHDAVMKVRMVPVETVFNRFPRMIRDISKELGKEIILEMSGEETELDRTVIDEIGDPLIHMLRNSADHGLELPEKRLAAGKPAEGLIKLKAYQDGNNVVIEVADDGQGINIEKVKQKAIEKGLVNKDVANNLSKEDIIDFMFKPSFSTADKVTDLSGRGVGLDVVKTKIESLGGVVEVETEMGKGTKSIIRLPLTLAIIQALLVYVGNEKYAIPLNSIKEIDSITTQDIKMVQKQEVILLRNNVVPIVRLDKVLNVAKDDSEPKQMTVVIVKKGEKLSGFIVDSLIGQQEIVVKSLGKLLSGIKLIAGATILGDGNVALILDVNSLA